MRVTITPSSTCDALWAARSQLALNSTRYAIRAVAARVVGVYNHVRTTQINSPAFLRR
jgi:predicted nucleotidyltransferase